MKTITISLIKKDRKRFILKADSIIIAEINNYLTTDLFGYTKKDSFIELEINSKKFYLKCVLSVSAGVNNAVPYYRFELISNGSKKLATFDLYQSLLNYDVRETFFYRSNGINYLTYNRSITKSYWSDEGNKQVLTYQNTNIEFDEEILEDKGELNILVTLTTIIEAFFIKKSKKTSIKIIWILVSIVLLTFLILLFI